MNILYISLENPYSSQNNGGIGTYTGVIATGISKAGNHVHIITVGDEDFTTDEGIKVHCISSSITRYSNYLEQSLKIYYKLNEILKDYKIDIIETPEWYAQGLISATECNIPIVTRLHTPLFLIENLNGGQKFYKDSTEIKYFEKLQSDRSSLLTVPCKDLNEIIEKEWGKESIVIPNPIDTTSYEVSNVEGNKNKLLYMGRLEYRKGVLNLADSLKKVFEKNDIVEMIFCGRDTFYKKKSMKKKIISKCLNFEERLTFLDHADLNLKKKLLEEVDIVIIPSLWENFSYVGLEAMSSGKTVIASNTGGFKEMIEDGKSGYLFSHSNPYELQDIIIKLLNGNLPHTGKEARKRIEKNFNINIIVEKYLEIYQQLVR
ncbi:MAG: glycosyltransferase family 4 protein [Sarcina sp.]